VAALNGHFIHDGIFCIHREDFSIDQLDVARPSAGIGGLGECGCRGREHSRKQNGGEEKISKIHRLLQ
jgi:hypothetical protein